MVAKTQPSTSATQCMGPAVTTPSRAGKGSRAHVLKVKEPAPGSLKAPIKRRVYGMPLQKEVRSLGVYGRESTHCRNWWEDLRRWARKAVDAQLEMASQRRRGARRTMTHLMACILAVAYPEMDGRLRASQQPQGG
ncbi:hypothetical protein NDU88_005728 [Pleurodeles waltl]|uniref:Uncharacterized protein n=1 Tax=Pleurodeles waltl TaxID=8319 RepID=A0AAV7TD33_PLEWA|nr:hypothetical protein NDU88_005728 [Pleurodeles waltl]